MRGKARVAVQESKNTKKRNNEKSGGYEVYKPQNYGPPGKKEVFPS